MNVKYNTIDTSKLSNEKDERSEEKKRERKNKGGRERERLTVLSIIFDFFDC